MQIFPRFADLTAPSVDRSWLEGAYADLDALLSGGQVAQAAQAFDHLRRQVETWSALAELRFSQDTTDPAAKQALEQRDLTLPLAKNFETAFQRRLLAEQGAPLLPLLGPHVLALWEQGVSTFSPEIEADLAEEARLGARYTELTAAAQIAIDGKVVNLEGLAPYREHLDRALRHEAYLAMDRFFAERGAELDDIYGQLIRLRHGMARKLGYRDFTELAYRRMRRLDYGPAEVARYREAVLEQVTPLVAQLLESRRRQFGWDAVYAWDEEIADPLGNPGPVGGDDALIAAGQQLYDRLHPELADLYRGMEAGGFLDLKNRPGKAGGGFCTAFPTAGMPFVFANFAGTAGDVEVLTHEMGHALQFWSSRQLPWIDQLWPANEAAEIHSMTLELLAHPQVGRLVGEEAAERYRRLHLIRAVSSLPRMAWLDHFQDEVYANPSWTPGERHACAARLSRRYFPWENWGDLEYFASGSSWQRVLHLYLVPFYMIDYALAQCCAFQLWSRSLLDFPGTVQQYVELCRLGGSLPFSGLVQAAGLASPFGSGCLERSVSQIAQVLL